MVEAAVGATLALEDGTRVVIPGGALESDAEVSLSRETCEGVYAATSFSELRVPRERARRGAGRTLHGVDSESGRYRGPH